MKCPECGYTTESMDVPIADGPPWMLCLACSVTQDRHVVLRRVFSAVGAIFRGGGWASRS